MKKWKNYFLAVIAAILYALDFSGAYTGSNK